jgi:hypothetical protein
VFLPFCIHDRRCTATSSADRAVAVVMVALFALQTDKMCDGTFRHYHFSVFSLNVVKALSSALNSSFNPIEEFVNILWLYKTRIFLIAIG